MQNPVRCPTCNGHGVIDIEDRNIKSQGVLRQVADEWCLSMVEMVSKSHRVRNYEARKEAARRLRELGMVHKEIADILGRERSTVTTMLRRTTA